MARLIDADALKALFDEQYDDAFMQLHTRPNAGHWRSYSIGINWGRNTIADAPTVDAVPVVHGRWRKTYTCHGERLWGYECSQCKADNPRGSYYCPNCGARMDGDANG